MKPLTNVALSTLADAVIRRTVDTMSETEELPRTVYGLSVTAQGELTSAQTLGADAEEPAAHVRRVQDAQRRFDAVGVVAAVRTGSATSGQQLDLLLYAENGTFHFNYTLGTVEGELRRIKFIRVPDAWEGLAPDIWSLTAKQCETLAKRLDRLLRDQPQGWEVHSCAVIQQLWVNQHVALTPMFDVISAYDLPPGAQRLAHAAFEQLYSFVPRSVVDASHGAPTDLWLCAVPLSVDMESVRAGEHVLPALAKEFVAQYEQQGSNALPGLKFLSSHDPLMVVDFVPVSLLAQVAHEWSKGREGQVTMTLRERAARHLHELLSSEVEAMMAVDFLVLAMCEVPIVEPRATGPGERPFGLMKVLADAQPGIDAAAARAGEKLGHALSASQATPAFDALRGLLDERHHRTLDVMVKVARTVRKDEEGNPLPVRAELAAVTVKKQQHETTFVTLWREDGSFVTAHRQQRLPYEGFPGYVEVMRDRLLEAGSYQVDMCQKLLRVEALPTDPQSRTPLLPDLQGNWFSPRDIFAPGCREIVQKVQWTFSGSATEADPELLTLPAPHLMLRRGLVEAASEHYMPGCYRAFKEAAADLTLDTHGVWARVSQQYPVVESVEAKLPGSVLPPLPYEFALRLHWSRSPTLKVRQTLVDRLNFTNLSLDVPMQLVRTPYPLCYVHFERPLETVEWEMSPAEEGRSPQVLALEGAFIHTVPRANGRRLYVLMLARSASDAALTVSQDLFFDIDNEALTLAHYLEAFRVAVGIPEEALNQLAPSVEMLAKVLLYLGVKNARLVPVTERSDTLKDLSSKKPDKQIKVLHGARGLYDHILVGPEQGMELPATPGLSGRTVAVHTRRGHMHGYWTGPRGSATLIGHFLEPVIVNKRLLGPDESPPAPKDYKIR